jgi:hypothetical protein
MKNKKLSNSLAFVSIVLGALWLGAYVTRLILTYNLFEEGEFKLKNFINSTNLGGIFLAFEPLYYITFITFVLFIICFTLFLISSSLRFKENGWLFIISIIIYFTLPFEVILMTIDYKIISSYFAGNFNSELTLTLSIERLQLLGGFSVILILCYLSIPYFIIFRPFSVNNQ